MYTNESLKKLCIYITDLEIAFNSADFEKTNAISKKLLINFSLHSTFTLIKPVIK